MEQLFTFDKYLRPACRTNSGCRTSIMRNILRDSIAHRNHKLMANQKLFDIIESSKLNKGHSSLPKSSHHTQRASSHYIVPQLAQAHPFEMLTVTKEPVEQQSSMRSQSRFTFNPFSFTETDSTYKLSFNTPDNTNLLVRKRLSDASPSNLFHCISINQQHRKSMTIPKQRERRLLTQRYSLMKIKEQIMKNPLINNEIRSRAPSLEQTSSVQMNIQTNNTIIRNKTEKIVLLKTIIDNRKKLNHKYNKLHIEFKNKQPEKEVTQEKQGDKVSVGIGTEVPTKKPFY